MGQTCCSGIPNTHGEAQATIKISPVPPADHARSAVDCPVSARCSDEQLHPDCRFIPTHKRAYKIDDDPRCGGIETVHCSPDRKLSLPEKITYATLSVLDSSVQQRMEVTESRIFNDKDTSSSPLCKVVRLGDYRKHSLQPRMDKDNHEREEQLSWMSEGHQSVISKSRNISIDIKLPERKEIDEGLGVMTPLSFHSDLGDLPQFIQNLSPTKSQNLADGLRQKSDLSNAESSFEEYEEDVPETTLNELIRKAAANELTTNDAVKWIIITENLTECTPEVSSGIYALLYQYHSSQCIKSGCWTFDEFRLFLMKAYEQGILSNSVCKLTR